MITPLMFAASAGFLLLVGMKGQITSGAVAAVITLTALGLVADIVRRKN